MDNEKDMISEFFSEEIISENREFDINISLEEVSKLNEIEAMNLAQLVEIELERYENILIYAEDLLLSEQEIINNGFNPEEFQRLKTLEKALYKTIRQIRRNQKGKGFFHNLPVWAIIVGFVCIIFNIIPVNPYLPILIYAHFFESYTSDFMLGNGGIILFFCLYLFVFYMTELILYFVLRRLGKKNPERKKAAFAFLIMIIITVAFVIPAIFIFINAISNL